MGKVLGLDVGLKKIGVAIGDRESGFAFPRTAWLVENWQQVWPRLQQLLAAESVETIVVGLPVDQAGANSRQAVITWDFIKQLKQRVALPVETRSERSTSLAVQREQAAHGRKLKRGEEDSLAAQLLVESYFQEKLA